MKQADNFDLKKYLVENKLGKDKSTVRGYVAVMGPEFEAAAKVIEKAWLNWKNAPMTNLKDKMPAKQDIMNYFDRILD